MKCVLFVNVIIILLALVAVNGGPSCRREISKYTRQNLACARHGLKIHSYGQKIAKGQMTYDELAAKIAYDCDRSNITYCYNKISRPIAGSCNKDESLQDFRNSFKVMLLFNEYLCQNYGQKYLDFVRDGGAECHINDRKAECYNNGKNAAKLTQPTLRDENLCTLLEIEFACLHHYEDCTNQNVGEFNWEFLISARDQLNC